MPHPSDDEARLPTQERDISFPNNADIPAAIPDGVYEVSFVRAETKKMWRQDKIFLWFKVESPGEWYGMQLYGACTVAKNGKWTAATKFWQWWVLAAGHRPARPDRLSTSVFRNKIFIAHIRKVVTTSKQHKRLPEQQYSVVDELVEVAAGS
jgi:hypothetical protein